MLEDGQRLFPIKKKFCVLTHVSVAPTDVNQNLALFQYENWFHFLQAVFFIITFR